MRAAIVAAVAFTMMTAVSPAAETRPLTAIQAIAAERGGEALNQCERLSLLFWPTMQPDALALMIVEPGEWAVLLNHPKPPAGFVAAEPVAKYRVGLPPDAEEQAEPGVWPVSVGDGAAVAGLKLAARQSLMLDGVRTAVVTFNEVTVPSPSFSGWPPTEATIGRMARMLWLAHLDSLEGEPGADPAIWDYTADATDLSLIAVEQRLLARIMRTSYNEKTMEGYRQMLAMWLAVRHARMDRNPAAVAMEERVERRAGLADFAETAPFRVMEMLGNEVRPALEAVDPFYDRYRNYFILRLNLLNYPMTWYPATPAEALQRARVTGAGLAYAAWPVSVKWNLDFFAPDGKKRLVLREVAENALGDEWPSDPNARADLYDEALEREEYETVLPVMEAILAEGGGVAQRRGGGAAGTLSVSLGPRRLVSYHAALDGQQWLGGRRYRLEGPVAMAFDAGSLDLARGWVQVESAAGRAAGLAPAGLRLPLEPGWKLMVGSRTLSSEKPGRAGRSLEGPVRFEAPGVVLTLPAARVTVTADGLDVADLPASP